MTSFFRRVARELDNPAMKADEARDGQPRTSTHHGGASGMVALTIAMGFAAYRP
jgi:hypothetical protein